MLSGIQHIAFCERQWALIHIEQCWQENVRTVEGQFLHKRVDDPFMDETRKNIRIVRSMPLVSYQLGLIGKADVVEFHKKADEDYWHTIKIPEKDGYWRVFPVEYKRGKPKKDDRDIVQLCAQAICIEEMMGVNIEYGELYYAQTRHRDRVLLNSEIRDRVFGLADKMQQYYSKAKTPPATKGKKCSLCSLVELCQPEITKKHRSVKNYIDNVISGLEKEDLL